MKHFREELGQRIVALEKIICDKEASLQNAPEGVINVCKTDGRIQYYYKKSSSETARKYLKNSEREFVEALCQKDYDQKVISAAKKELKQLDKLRKGYPLQTCEDIYENLNHYRKVFVNPIMMSDEDYVRKWESMEYERKGFREDAPEYYTDKGERVRSKTEILIANALIKYDIPYRYECPLYLKGYGVIYPDFTVLNIRERKEMYWEHMGMMDNPDYIANALQRILLYEKNNLFPGDKLILTHETLKYPIYTKMIEKVIFQYLK